MISARRAGNFKRFSPIAYVDWTPSGVAACASAAALSLLEKLRPQFVKRAIRRLFKFPQAPRPSQTLS